jgi:hypothetical protein
MTAHHRLSGYSKSTELLATEIDVPDQWLGYVIDVAGVDRSQDPEAVGAYPIAVDKLAQLGDLLKPLPNPGAYDWFLEAFEGEEKSA